MCCSGANRVLLVVGEKASQRKNVITNAVFELYLRVALMPCEISSIHDIKSLTSPLP